MLQDIELEPNKINWASLVRHLLMSPGFYNVWLNQGVCNKNVFISVFKQRLTDTFIQIWQSRLNNYTRAFCFIKLSPYFVFRII